MVRKSFAGANTQQYKKNYYASANDIQRKKKLPTLQSLIIISKIGLSPSLPMW